MAWDAPNRSAEGSRGNESRKKKGGRSAAFVWLGFAADLTWGKGRFNTLTGLFATAVAVGGIAGPLAGGFLVQHAGFKFAFLFFAALALGGSMIFTVLVPETKKNLESLLLHR